jgi:hypothetical protein
MVTAAVVEKKDGPFELTEVVLDELRPEEVRVRMHAVGMCHTDLVVGAQQHRRAALLGADARRPLREERVDEIGGEGVEVVAGAEIDAMEPHLPGAHPRDLGGRDGAAQRAAHGGVPGGPGQGIDRGEQPVVGSPGVIEDVGGGPPGAALDVVEARGRVRVHRRLDAGTGPGEEVVQGVRVARQVGQHMGTAPAGQQRVAFGGGRAKGGEPPAQER